MTFQKTVFLIRRWQQEKDPWPLQTNVLHLQKDRFVKLKVDYAEATGTDTIFDFWYTDGEGTKYTLQAQGEDGDPNADGEVTHLLYTMRLQDYSQEEAFVTYSYKYKWILEEPLVIPVQ